VARGVAAAGGAAALHRLRRGLAARLARAPDRRSRGPAREPRAHRRARAGRARGAGRRPGRGPRRGAGERPQRAPVRRDAGGIPAAAERLDPAGYLGSAELFVDRALAAHAARWAWLR
jgi:hypothetical protein